MALETLKDVKEIGGFEVVCMDTLRDQYPDKFNESGSMDWRWFESEIRPNKFIYVRNDKNSISFTLQNGPIKEVGVNGCQVDTLIEAAKMIIEGFQNFFPCRENAIVINKLDEAILCLHKRKIDREKRGRGEESAMSAKEFIVSMDTDIICSLHSLWPRCCQHPEARGLDCEGNLNIRPYLCPLKEHDDLSKCAQKYQDEIEAMRYEATKKLGW